MIDALAYCNEKAAAPGSDFALTREFAPAAQRPALTALYALYMELMNIAYTVRELDMAYAKLGWWEEELKRARQDKASHPVTQALTQYAPQVLDNDGVFELVQGALIHVDPQAPDDEAALLALARATGGVRGRLEACIGQSSGDAHAPANLLGSASQLVRWLLLLPRDLGQGRLLLPLNELARFELTRTDLRRVQPNKNRSRIIQVQCGRIIDMLDDALQRLPKDARVSLRHLQINAALDRARCQTICKSGEAAFKTTPKLKPVKKLYIAWRAARRVGKQA